MYDKDTAISVLLGVLGNFADRALTKPEVNLFTVVVSEGEALRTGRQTTIHDLIQDARGLPRIDWRKINGDLS